MNATPKPEAAACLSSMLRTETWSFPSSGIRSHAIRMKNSKHHTIPPSTSKLFGEWQQRGPEAFSGYVVQKLRLTLAPRLSVATANAPGGKEEQS